MQVSTSESRAIVPFSPRPLFSWWRKILEGAFLIPVADLRLRVVIPLERLTLPEPRPLAPLREDCNPLSYFSPSRDLERFASFLQMSGDVGVRAVSACCDALAMYDGSLARRHEERIPLRMLGYFGHAADRFRGAFPQLIATLERDVVKTLGRRRPLLEQIIRYETAREQLAYLELNEFAELFQEYYRAQARRRGVKRVLVDFWVPICTPETEAVHQIVSSRVIGHERKVELARGVWNGVAPDERAVAEGLFVIEEHRRFLEGARRERDNCERRLQRMKVAEFSNLGRQIGALFELEGLQRAVETLDGLHFDRMTHREDRKSCLEQSLVVLREATKLVVSDLAINSSRREAIRPLAQAIKEVRDYLEHPEDYAFHWEAGKSPEDWLSKLWDELADGGLAKARAVLQRRVCALQRLFSPHDQKEPESLLTGLAQRSDETVADVARELARGPFPVLCEMRERLTRRAGWRTAAGTEESGSLQPLRDLRERIRGLNRSQLRSRLEQNYPFRLTVQREIARCYRVLEAAMWELNREGPQAKVAHQHFEQAFYHVRDARNFQTHDLWRDDVTGTLNVAYLLAYDLLEAATPWRPFGEDSSEAALFGELVHGRLDCGKLQAELDRGFDPNCRDYKGRTLLLLIADYPSKQNLELARLLISRGANIHAADYLGLRPLHITCESGFSSLAKDLLGKGAVVDLPSARGTPTEIAQRHEHEELARLLLPFRGRSRDEEARTLFDAVANLDVDRVARLVEQRYRADVPVLGELPLAALFRKEDADVPTQIAIAGLLLKAGAEVNQQEPTCGQTVVHAAATYCDDGPVIAFLLRSNPNIHLIDDQERTALHCAVEAHNVSWTRCLLEQGASVSMRETLGFTPLLSVTNSICPPPQLVSLLLAQGANSQEGDEFGTPLHSAVDRGLPASVELLCRAGASPFIAGWGGKYLGRTAIQVATGRNRSVLVWWGNYLVDHLEPADVGRLMGLT